jgi:hypothetical protein
MKDNWILIKALVTVIPLFFIGLLASYAISMILRTVEALQRSTGL